MIGNWIINTPGTRTFRRELYETYCEKSGDKTCTPNLFYKELKRYGFKERKGKTRDFLDVSIADEPVNNTLDVTAQRMDKRGYVYFITDGELVKIGSAKNVYDRLRVLQVSNGKRLVILKTLYFDNRYQGERIMHELFENRRVFGEWFDILGVL